MAYVARTQTFNVSAYTLERYRRIQELLDQLDPQAPSQALVLPDSPAPAENSIVFPGSFNPPTSAHVAMLQQAWQFARLHVPTNVYAAISTHITDKERVQRPLLLDRVTLLETVLRKRVRDTGIMLFNRGLYVEQAEAIQRAFPQVSNLYFLIGFDKILQIFDPHYYRDREQALHELFALADFLVAPRAEAGPEELKKLLNQPENRQYAGHVHALPLSAAFRYISSTSIRRSPGAYEQDVPLEVRRFIRETHAYDPPLELQDGTKLDQYGERMRAIESALETTHGEK